MDHLFQTTSTRASGITGYVLAVAIEAFIQVTTPARVTLMPGCPEEACECASERREMKRSVEGKATFAMTLFSNLNILSCNFIEREGGIIGSF